MRKEFLFQEDEESLDQYLSKAAKWLNQLKTGEIEDDILEELYESEEKQICLKNYIFKVMEDTLVNYAKEKTRTWTLKESKEDFYQNLAYEVWRNLYKFNNPEHNTRSYTSSFQNFLNVYCRRGAIQSSVLFYKHYTKHLHRQMRQLQRALDKLVEETNLEEENIPFNCLYERVNDCGYLNLTENTVRFLWGEKFTSDSCEVKDQDIEYYEYGFDKIFRIDEEVREQLLKFYGTLRPIQQFIILQNYELCDDPWRKMSVKELGCDNYFLSIARQDRFTAKRIKRGNVTIKNQKDEVTGKRIRNKELTFRDVEYLDEDYILGIRGDLTRRLSKFIKLHEYGAKDLEGVIGDVSYEVWCELKKQFFC